MKGKEDPELLETLAYIAVALKQVACAITGHHPQYISGPDIARCRLCGWETEGWESGNDD